MSNITFWQALGIFILCKILFGFGKGGSGGPAWMKHKMRDKWRHMDDSERDKFKAEMKNRMCGWNNWSSKMPD